VLRKSGVKPSIAGEVSVFNRVMDTMYEWH